jgi:hypothetical protein
MFAQNLASVEINCSRAKRFKPNRRYDEFLRCAHAWLVMVCVRTVWVDARARVCAAFMCVLARARCVCALWLGGFRTHNSTTAPMLVVAYSAEVKRYPPVGQAMMKIGA